MHYGLGMCGQKESIRHQVFCEWKIWLTSIKPTSCYKHATGVQYEVLKFITKGLACFDLKNTQVQPQKAYLLYFWYFMKNQIIIDHDKNVH